MSKLKEKQLTTRNVYRGSFLDVYCDEVELPDGRTSGREYIKHPGAVVIIPIMPDGKIGLIRQYRYPMGMEQIELPAGKLDPGETHEETATRELEEEIGYKAGKLIELAEIHPCIGYSDERMWIYLAEDLKPANHNMDHDEFIEFMPIELDQALEMVWTGQITDTKTIVGILWAEKILKN